MFKKFFILIFVYNEGLIIYFILNKIDEVEFVGGLEKEIIIVNDCFMDNIVEKVEEFIVEYLYMNICFFSQFQNMGKGVVINWVIQECFGEYLVIQDVDLEYDLQEYNLLLKLVFYDNVDVVYGFCFQGYYLYWILFFWYFIGNKMLMMLFNMMINFNLMDMEMCYKLICFDLVKKIDIKECCFGIELEIIVKFLCMCFIWIYEVGIFYYG